MVQSFPSDFLVGRIFTDDVWEYKLNTWMLKLQMLSVLIIRKLINRYKLLAGLKFCFVCRLVIDRETGKPKGYGFCEYKDEETALSARRNLQGYEINGRQLRVDFAENDKGADRNREQVKFELFRPNLIPSVLL